ncbi:MAG TPA: DUF4383 domain-containing protein [Coleofasciculaceae cyanobacterium]|jgi:hypothetical protein
MLTTYAKVMGIILVAIGILGFIPGIAPDGMLFGIFMVNAWHNIVHLFSGAVFLAVAFSDNWELTRKVVLAFAIIYGLVTILGFFTPDGGLVLGMRDNMADDILHLAITASALLIALPQRRPTLMR